MRPCRRCGAERVQSTRGKPVCVVCRRRTRRVHGPVLGVTEDGLMKASCWCEATFVFVPVEDIRACRTGSCGRDTCHPIEVEA